jgi:hypothetical protein
VSRKWSNLWSLNGSSLRCVFHIFDVFHRGFIHALALLFARRSEHVSRFSETQRLHVFRALKNSCLLDLYLLQHHFCAK